VRAVPGASLGEVLDRPMTAHFIGGAVIGADPERGVLDPYLRVWGHPGLCVVDGAAVSANLGVNPALSITAQAERAMSLWPNRGDADLRPSQAEPYAVLAAVPPRQPAVPGLLRVQVLRPSPQGVVEGAGAGSAHHVVSVAGVTMEP
ncbi:MAG TPA: GMC oxidoreductase, partial [Ornithinibacter sp.]|nr:GMC oxidoreductase [Ornithinibacter sp.]